MKTLLGIIFFHVLVILRAKTSKDETFPFITTAILTLLLTGFVVFMMYIMEEPTP